MLSTDRRDEIRLSDLFSKRGASNYGTMEITMGFLRDAVIKRDTDTN